MKAQHTPGPWVLKTWPHERECMGATLPGTFAIVGANNISPGVVWGGLPECEGNARLIAAAPELREFCAMAARLTKDGEETPEHPDGYDMPGDDAVDALAELVNHARALLARIDGTEGGSHG